MLSVPTLGKWKAEDHAFKILSGYAGSPETASSTGDTVLKEQWHGGT